MSTESAQPRKSRRLLIIAGLILSWSITLGSIFFVIYRLRMPSTTSSGAAIVDSSSYFDGVTPIDPPRKVADFTLTGTDGQPLSLSDLYGKVTLLYFGYTHCPDVCPLTLGDFKRVKDKLGDNASKVNFLMVSVDGARDTPEQMKRFLSGFDPSFVGMTGNTDQLQAIAPDYDLYFHANVEEGENYTVDHTASIFVIDPEGNLRMSFTFGTDPDVIVGHLKDLLS